MKNKKFKVAAILAVVVIAIGASYYYVHSSGYEDTDDAFQETDIVPISARVSGYVQTVSIHDNQKVEAGQVLAQLDPRDFQVRLDQAKADLDAQQADVLRTAGDVQRYASLVKKDEISKQRYDYAQAEAAKARAQLDSAKARKEQAALDLYYAEIKAPAAGKVTKKSVTAGSYVQAGQPLLTLVSSDLWVIANFKETQVKKMLPGQPVLVKIDAIDKTVKAHVDSIQAGSGTRFSLFPPENATGNFIKVVQRIPVKIVFDEKPPELSTLGPGLSVVPQVKIQ